MSEKVPQPPAEGAVEETDPGTETDTESKMDPALQFRLDKAKVEEQEAKSRKAELDNKTAEEKAQQDRVNALVPDLMKATGSTLDVPKDGALYSTTLAHRALVAAADSLGNDLPALENAGVVLVTTETEFADGCTVYLDVSGALEGLLKSIAVALDPIEPPTPTTGAPVRGAMGIVFFAALPAALTAAAQALPAVLSLFSAKRSVSTGVIDANDLAATAAVSRALLARKDQAYTIRHDSFRTVPRGNLHHTMQLIGSQKNRLSARRLTIIDSQADVAVELTTATSNVAAIQAKLDNKKPVPTEKQKVALNAELNKAKEAAAEIEGRATSLKEWQNLVDATNSTVDAALAAISVMPTGSKRSLLATATLFEGVYPVPPETQPEITHALLIKGERGQATQVTEDRPFWSDDRFSTFVESAVTYLLMETSTGNLKASGTASGTASARGKIGDSIDLDPVVVEIGAESD